MSTHKGRPYTVGKIKMSSVNKVLSKHTNMEVTLATHSIRIKAFKIGLGYKLPKEKK